MLEEIRRLIREALDRRAAAQASIDGVLSAAEAENRTELTEDETATFTEARTALRAADDEIGQLQAREAELVEIAESRAAADRVAASLPAPAGTPEVRVGREEPVYRPDGADSFILDVYRRNQDPTAAARLARHQEQASVEFRDVGTGAFAGLVVPQYLTEMYAPRARAGRPFADAIRSLDLPPAGNTVNISRITTGTAVAAQATENSAVQETDIDDTLLTVNVRTIAGQQDVSRQAIDRGANVDQVVVADLVSAYHTELDRQCIATDGTSGTHLGVLGTSGINAVTYTDASPTVGETIPKLADAIQQVNSAFFGSADLIVMHPRRWGWFLAAVDTANRPLVVPNPQGPFNAAGLNGAPGQYGQVVGSLLGLPVITDANIPTNLGAGTNEDRIIVCNSQEVMLWEDGSPLQLRFEDVGAASLTVKFVVFGYSAFTAGRYPASVSVISGTGLVTPTF